MNSIELNTPPLSIQQQSAIQTQLNALEQELKSLKQQNIELYNELTKQNATLFNMMQYINSKHLNHYIFQLASTSSAEFILENMPKAKSFDGDGAGEILKYSVEQISVDGLILEFGVASGRTINIISSMKLEQIIYGFDSFEGLPEDWRTGWNKGTFDLKGNLPRVNPNVELIKGWFDESLPKFLKSHEEPISFLHVDCDLCSSTKTVLTLLSNRMVSGTIILFDEYFNYPSWQEGEHKAFKEFVDYYKVNFEFIAYSNDEQVAVKIK